MKQERSQFIFGILAYALGQIVLFSVSPLVALGVDATVVGLMWLSRTWVIPDKNQ